MIWVFGLGCIAPYNRRICERIDGGGKNLEQNEFLLSADSGADEPRSVHSSFRFIVGSNFESEKSLTSATVLMVNMENGLIDMQTRTEFLERLISPVALFLIRFSYSEILSITRNFSKGRILGKGAMGSVFRGRLGFMGTSLAIKRLDKHNKESSKAFCRELMIASTLHDPHIVSLVGYCIDSEEGLFLVYKYVSGGSLDRFLHDKKGMNGGCAASWSIRYKVAVGIAEAINYLHNGTERCVVHRDIKPSNILLTSRKTPKLCDFGLASWTPAPSVPFLCKMVKGTFGYLAPEYFQHGKVSIKTDIYAFGVVLLELITGRKPIESRRGNGEENLVTWAKPFLHQGSTEKLLDPQIKYSTKNSTQISQLVHAAAACLNNDEFLRPGAGEILEMLRGGGHKELCRRKALLSCKEPVIYSEIKNHIALAMQGIDYEDDDRFDHW